MTRDEILSASPSQINELIDELMEYKHTAGDYPNWSGDIKASWEVVDKLQGLRELNGRKVRLAVKVLVIRGAYTVSVIDYLNNDNCIGEEIANSAPEAICKAALLALE